MKRVIAGVMQAKHVARVVRFKRLEREAPRFKSDTVHVWIFLGLNFR